MIFAGLLHSKVTARVVFQLELANFFALPSAIIGLILLSLPCMPATLNFTRRVTCLVAAKASICSWFRDTSASWVLSLNERIDRVVFLKNNPGLKSQSSGSNIITATSTLRFSLMLTRLISTESTILTNPSDIVGLHTFLHPATGYSHAISTSLGSRIVILTVNSQSLPGSGSGIPSITGSGSAC